MTAGSAGTRKPSSLKTKLAGAMAPASPATRADALAPLHLPADLRLSTEQFAAVCTANPEAVLELSADGHLIHITPTGGETGARNQTLGALLWIAVRSSGLPLPAVRQLHGLPPARWFGVEPRYRAGEPEALAGAHCRAAARLSPALPRSGGGAGQCRRRRPPRPLRPAPQDGPYQANGVQLGWLLIPEQQAVEIWPAGGSPSGTPQRLEAPSELEAGPLFPGLVLRLREIWQV